jgi:hypothetical protein
MSRRAFESQIRRGRRRTFALWFLAPLLMCVQLLAGRGVLWHAHGDEGPHVHLLPSAIDASEHGVDRAWHAGVHARDEHHAEHHDHDKAHADDLERHDAPTRPHLEAAHEPSALGIPSGVRLEAPSMCLVAALRATDAAPLALGPPRRCTPVSVECAEFRPPRDWSVAAARPRVRQVRSGTALLLSSSRALRI